MRPPTIVHIEGGRMDAPKGDRLMELLAVYGVTDYRSFYSRVRNYTERRQPIDELKELIVRISPERVVIALEILKQVAEGKRVIAV